jgi:hypothetical protein
MMYIAHIREKDKQIQAVEAHLLEVKEIAEGFGAKTNLPIGWVRFFMCVRHKYEAIVILEY